MGAPAPGKINRAGSAQQVTIAELANNGNIHKVMILASVGLAL